MKKEFIPLAAGGVLFAAALVIPAPKAVSIVLYIAAYLCCGAEVLTATVRNIFGLKGKSCACSHEHEEHAHKEEHEEHGHTHQAAHKKSWNIFDENFLMTLATLGAFAIGEYPEGVAVMLFYQLGEQFQHRAVENSRRAISGLMKLRPEFARVLRGGKEETVAPQDVQVGDMILVRPGERIPLDGEIIKGTSALDTSALTGESLPREMQPGEAVLAGSVNLSGVLEIRVSKVYAQSAVAKILELVQNASSKKTHTEEFIRRFARWYTPAVVIGAVLVAFVPPLVCADALLKTWVYRALVFLVLSCPCALVISVPLGFFGGLGGAARNGILVKGSNYLEALAHLDTLLFDKTGTLTQGSFEVTAVTACDGNSAALLEYVALAEQHSTHPLALAVVKAYAQTPQASRVTQVQETAGKGVRATVDGKTVLAGTRKFLAEQGVSLPQDTVLTDSAIFAAADGAYIGHILLADQLKKDAQHAVTALKQGLAGRVVMLSGDAAHTVDAVGKTLALDEAYGSLLPADKMAHMERYLAAKPAGMSVGFVGDGINDAPVLARADVGIAMGGLGSDAAVEAADVVLMTDEPSKVALAVKIARKTRQVVKQNILLALSIKTVVLVLGVLGMATMWEAVFADVGVTVLAVLNALRPLYFKSR